MLRYFLQGALVLMSCYLLKIFSFRIKKVFHSDTDPAAAAGAADAAFAAASAAASAAAASAECIYYGVLGGRFAPPYMYMIKNIQQQQKQQQKQQLQTLLPPELGTLTHHEILHPTKH